MPYNKLELLDLIKKRPDILLNPIYSEYLQDEDFVRKALDVDNAFLSWASEDIRSDEVFILSIVDKHPGAIFWASDSLKNNRDFLLRAIEFNADVFSWISEKNRHNESFILAAIEKNVKALSKAPLDFRQDEAFIISAIKIHGHSVIQYAELSDESRDELIRYAEVEMHKNAFLKAVKYTTSQESKDEHKPDDISLIYQRLTAKSEYKFSPSYGVLQLFNRLIYEKAEDYNPSSNFEMSHLYKMLLLSIIKYNNKDDKNKILVWVKTMPGVLEWTSESIKSDPEFVMTAIGCNPVVLLYSDFFNDNETFVQEALTRHGPEVLQWASDRLQKNEKLISLAQAIQSQGELIDLSPGLEQIAVDPPQVLNDGLKDPVVEDKVDSLIELEINNIKKLITQLKYEKSCCYWYFKDTSRKQVKIKGLLEILELKTPISQGIEEIHKKPGFIDLRSGLFSRRTSKLITDIQNAHDSKKNNLI
ncbi:MAG: DUF4116 domain-containing protein [Legionella sp.]|nr:DUF4116 domain-containing protein [Legionella sp.]